MFVPVPLMIRATHLRPGECAPADLMSLERVSMGGDLLQLWKSGNTDDWGMNSIHRGCECTPDRHVS